MASLDHVQTDKFAVDEVTPAPQQPAITDVPTGTPDSGQNAAAINDILAALRTFGLIAQ